jgi:hypothetical protein
VSGPILTLLLCAMVIVVAGASYRRRGGSEAAGNPRLATGVALGLVVLALALAAWLYVRRQVG